MGEFTHNTGVTQQYGPRDAETALTRKAQGFGVREELIVDFTYADVNSTDGSAWWKRDASGGATPDSPMKSNAYIPANATLMLATLIVNTAFTSAGAATLSLGLCQRAGTVIDADGIDATIAKATLAAGAVVACDGALVGVDVGANDAFVYGLYGTAVFTAGSARLVLEYIPAATVA